MSGWWQCITLATYLVTSVIPPTLSAHYCQQCYLLRRFPFLFSAKAIVGGLCVRMVAVLQLTTGNNALATYLLRCFRLLFQRKQAFVAYMSGWWQCISSLPTMLWRPTYFGASAHSLSTTSIGGLCARVVAVHQLTTANNALATYSFSKGKRRWSTRQKGGSTSAHLLWVGDLPACYRTCSCISAWISDWNSIVSQEHGP